MLTLFSVRDKLVKWPGEVRVDTVERMGTAVELTSPILNPSISVMELLKKKFTGKSINTTTGPILQPV